MNRITAHAFTGMDPGITAGDRRVSLASGSTSDRTLSTSAQVSSWPFYVDRPRTVDEVYIRLVTAQSGAEMRAGIYKNNPATGRPHTLIQDLGTLDVSSGSGTDKAWAAAAVVVGYFWVVIWNKDVATAVTVRGPSVVTPGPALLAQPASLHSNFGGNLISTSAYPGSMPDPFGLTGGLTSGLLAPMPMVKFA